MPYTILSAPELLKEADEQLASRRVFLDESHKYMMTGRMEQARDMLLVSYKADIESSIFRCAAAIVAAINRQGPR